MKHFNGGKLQLIAYDEETEKNYTLTLGNLVQDADVEVISTLGKEMDKVIDGYVDFAQVIESFHVSI